MHDRDFSQVYVADFKNELNAIVAIWILMALNITELMSARGVKMDL